MLVPPILALRLASLRRANARVVVRRRGFLELPLEPRTRRHLRLALRRRRHVNVDCADRRRHCSGATAARCARPVRRADLERRDEQRRRDVHFARARQAAGEHGANAAAALVILVNERWREAAVEVEAALAGAVHLPRLVEVDADGLEELRRPLLAAAVEQQHDVGLRQARVHGPANVTTPHAQPQTRRVRQDLQERAPLVLGEAVVDGAVVHLKDPRLHAHRVTQERRGRGAGGGRQRAG